MAIVVRIQNSEMVSSHQSSSIFHGSPWNQVRIQVMKTPSLSQLGQRIVLENRPRSDGKSTTSCEALFLPWIWHVSSLIIRYYKVDRLQCGALSPSFLLICWPQIMKKFPIDRGTLPTPATAPTSKIGGFEQWERKNVTKNGGGKKNIQNDDFTIFEQEKMFLFLHILHPIMDLTINRL